MEDLDELYKQFEAGMTALAEAMLQVGLTCEQAAENIVRSMERMGVNLSEIE